MTITHLSAARTWRGGEQQLAWLLRELDAMGVRQQVLCVSESPLHRWVVRHLPHIGIVPYSKRSPYDPFTARLVRQAVQPFGSMLVHAHDAHAHTMAWLATLLWGLDRPLVLSRRVAFPPSRSLPTRKKYLHPAVARVLCVSACVRKQMLDWGMPAERLAVVYDGVELERFRQSDTGRLHELAGWPRNVPVVGYAGALTEEKDLATWLRAAARVAAAHGDVYFALIGDGPQRAELEALAHNEGIADRTWFAGFRDDVAALLPSLRVLLFTSRSEGLGTTLLDAMAAGVPVVATRAGGIPEVVQHEQTGLLAPVGDADLLASHVLHLLKAEAFRQRLVEAARQRVRHFSKEKMARRTLACYRSVS